MAILKFMLATVVTALCLDSLYTNWLVLQVNPDIIGWVALVSCAKLIVAAVMVAVALWIRSAWMAWHG